jgi:capsular polysaccharide transport system permease protein
MKDTPETPETTIDKADVARKAPELPKRPVSTKAKPRYWLRASFVLLVIMPIILSAFYYAFVASDRYVVEVKFAVRSPSGDSGGSDLSGLMTGMPSGGITTVDSYMVTDFLQSRSLIDKLETRIDLRGMFDPENVDFFSRFSRTRPKEEFIKYLKWRINPYFDNSSQIITVEVQAFTPEDARRLASEVLALSGELVNEVSERARLDTVRSAEEEVRRNEMLLRDHRAKMAQFRDDEQDIDPTRSVESQQVLLSRLEGELSQKQTMLATLLEFLNTDAPRVKFLDSEIAALEQQVAMQRARLGGGGAGEGGQTLSQRVSDYEELAVDLEFLQRAYVSSMTSLEAARLEADRQQRYLAAFVLPSTPEKAIYPRRFINVVLVAVLAFMAWSITVLFGAIIREHLP